MSLNLFNEAIQYASTISDSNKPFIKYLSKVLLFHNRQSREKKPRDPQFDGAMSCYDVAEVCELMRIFIFLKLSNIIDKPGIDSPWWSYHVWQINWSANGTEKKKEISKSADFQ